MRLKWRLWFINIPLQPGDYAFTLIEGAKNVKISPLKIKKDKQNKRTTDSYKIGNLAVLHMRAWIANLLGFADVVN